MCYQVICGDCRKQLFRCRCGPLMLARTGLKTDITRCKACRNAVTCVEYKPLDEYDLAYINSLRKS
jgi:hypothetical protein